MSLARASVLINAAPTKEFKITKGVRQGDALSLFLFIIAMEGLNVVLKTTRDKNLFKAVKIPGNGSPISHLFTLTTPYSLGNDGNPTLKNLASILKCFHVSYVLKVNFNKSKFYGIWAPTLEITQWAGLLVCKAGSFPYIYLGVPVSAN